MDISLQAATPLTPFSFGSRHYWLMGHWAGLPSHRLSPATDVLQLACRCSYPARQCLFNIFCILHVPGLAEKCLDVLIGEVLSLPQLKILIILNKMTSFLSNNKTRTAANGSKIMSTASARLRSAYTSTLLPRTWQGPTVPCTLQIKTAPYSTVAAPGVGLCLLSGSDPLFWCCASLEGTY